MIGALFYYQRHSLQNRVVARIRRLRQPKYLFGAIVGAFYFYTYIFRAFNRGRNGPVLVTPEHQELVQTLAALALFFMAALGWILPSSRAALAFSEAEVAFLFPAPIGRKMLIHFKLMRSQMAILFSALFMTLIGRSWSNGNFAVRIVGWWLAFSTLSLHLMGSSFVLTRMMDRGLSNWLRRIIFLTVGGVIVGGVLLWAYFAAPRPPSVEGLTDTHWLSVYAAQLLHSGPLPYLLYPFRLVVAPYFATSLRAFLLALGPALAVLGLHYWWVVHSNVAFEEASLELSKKTADRVAAARSGHWSGARAPKKAKRPPFQLGHAGPPLIALFWKNLISAGSFVTTRFWIFLIWVAVVGGMFLQSKTHQGGGMGEALSFLIMGLLGLSLFFAPQLLRNDLRQDLPVTDILKMFPMPGWQVVLGEVMAPVAILAAIQWLLVLVGVFLFPDRLDNEPVSLVMRVSFAVGIAVVLPFVDFAALLIPNAAVLFFPAWFQLGKEAPRGFEATGQRLILMFGQLLILVVSLAPAAALFAIIFFGGSHFFSPAPLAVVGSLVAAGVLAVEAAMGLKFLGSVFERFDLSAELSDLQ
jgi:hypothetical protein